MQPANSHLVSFSKGGELSPTPNPSTKFYFDAVTAKVTTNRELLADTGGGKNSTKHIEVRVRGEDKDEAGYWVGDEAKSGAAMPNMLQLLSFAIRFARHSLSLTPL